MDKAATGEVIDSTKLPGLTAAPKRVLSRQVVEQIGSLPPSEEEDEDDNGSGIVVDLWNESVQNLGCNELCIKPVRDGCSTGEAGLCVGAIVLKAPFS